MTNSITILLAALVFLAFGYASLVRIAYKQYFADSQGSLGKASTHLAHLINDVGQGTIFTCLAATSLLLFWGWGMALLWLIAFHLLADTLFNFQISTAESAKASKAKTTNVEPRLSDHLMALIWQLYLLLIIAIAVALVVNLINQQTGLIFALIALVPAHLLLRNKDTGALTFAGMAIAILVLLLGLLFSHQLGISIYGAFNPIESLGYPDIASQYFAWLVFDNTSIITIALIISVLVLSDQSKFRADLSNMSGVFILIIIGILLAKFIWLRPLIDAPLNSTQTREVGLPAYSSFGLFLFAGLSLLLLRQNEQAQKKTPYKKLTDGLDGSDDPAPSAFVSQQLNSLVLTLFSILILLALACALGIGAWNTHYADWSNAGSLTTHFNLAITSTLNLINSTANSGSITFSLFMVSLSFIGFALLLNVTAKLGAPLSTSHQPASSFVGIFKKSRVIPALILYFISSYLVQNGIGINEWLIVGMLAWLLVTDTLVVNSLTYEGDGRNQLVQNGLSLALMALGAIQITWTAVRWANMGETTFCVLAAITLLVAGFIWKNQIAPLIGAFKNTKPPELFS